MTKALKITTAGAISLVDVDELEDYQREVGGDIEAVPVSETYTMVLDEEGKLKGAASNPIATLLRAHLAPADIIVGDALIVRSADDITGDWGDIDEVAERQIRALGTLL